MLQSEHEWPVSFRRQAAFWSCDDLYPITLLRHQASANHEPTLFSYFFSSCSFMYLWENFLGFKILPTELISLDATCTTL